MLEFDVKLKKLLPEFFTVFIDVWICDGGLAIFETPKQRPNGDVSRFTVATKCYAQPGRRGIQRVFSGDGTRRDTKSFDQHILVGRATSVHTVTRALFFMLKYNDFRTDKGSPNYVCKLLGLISFTSRKITLPVAHQPPKTKNNNGKKKLEYVTDRLFFNSKEHKKSTLNDRWDNKKRNLIIQSTKKYSTHDYKIVVDKG